MSKYPKVLSSEKITMDSTINGSGDVNFGPSFGAEYNIQSFLIVLYIILASELYVTLEGSGAWVSILHRL